LQQFYPCKEEDNTQENVRQTMPGATAPAAKSMPPYIKPAITGQGQELCQKRFFRAHALRNVGLPDKHINERNTFKKAI